MLVYEQKTGKIFKDSELLGTGYAGRGVGLNNPLMQDVRFVGPLPCGFYTMEPPRDDTRVGKYAIPLVPDESNEMFGRSAFFIHGDNMEHPGAHVASDGCMIQDHDVRVRIWTDSADKRLQVVSGVAPDDVASTFNKGFGI